MKNRILKYIDPAEPGLEIGGGFYPKVFKKDGVNLEILNLLTRDELVAQITEKKRKLNLTGGVFDDLSLVEEVDHVWKGESYAELTGKPNHYHWIIASHVIEHVPDLIGFINDCASVLNKEKGVLSLAIPDKRFLFDRFRALSGIGFVIDSHLNACKTSTLGSVIEADLYSVLHNGSSVWRGDLADEQKTFELRTHFDKPKMEGFVSYMQEQVRTCYVDRHRWCFTPTSFRLLIEDLYQLGFIELREIDFQHTVGCEFFMTLGFNGEGFNTPRLDALKAIEKEQADFSLQDYFPGVKRLVDQVNEKCIESVSIYGAGVIGDSVINYISSNTNIKISKVFDRDKTGNLYGYTIEPTEAISNLPDGHCILIASQSFKEQILQFFASHYEEKNFDLMCFHEE
ncbi:hypothetical protein [Aestuariibacter sp. A3R04]|uniref:hypothetical protein n=1 Tax=Aestuariibacter sp. A3R04 TaxID=2841571 RepID=UPI001C0A622E|nr:hypothetical protein [Aestuariibacter sp. A3R04]MBU3020291.1 hypothetical protein [Aestuariibacter sp. A3R04]